MSNTENPRGFNYAPVTSSNGPLAKYEVGATVSKTVRAVNCIYYSEGFQVYQVEIVNSEGYFVTIVGTFPYRLVLNAYYNVEGIVSEDKRGEKQIKVTSCESTLPTDYNGIITVLKTLHGLDTQAYQLYDKVGPEILELLKTDPDKVASMVKGVGKKRVRAWQEELLARGENDREMRRLYGLGMTAQQATRLVAEHGINICAEIERNPYKLIDLAHGYTFKKCDTLALGSGKIGLDHPDRLRAGIMYTLSAFEGRGHSAVKFDEFMKQVHQLLDFSINSKVAYKVVQSQNQGQVAKIKWGQKVYPISIDDLLLSLQDWEAAHNIYGSSEPFSYVVDPISNEHLDAAFGDLKTGDHLVIEEQDGERYVCSSQYYVSDNTIASCVRDFVQNERLPFSDTQRVLDAILAKEGITLEDKQYAAVMRICAAHGGIFILNGSAGCGKTFTLNIIIKVLRRLYQSSGTELSPCILAPTGKAAKVASNATGLPAYTIHRALGLVTEDTQQSMQKQSLSNNCVIVDEFSMVDEILCAQLFDGVSKSSKVILLGDTAQLPSVRPGKVLRDLIDSQALPVITLDVVKRQASGSGVLENAKKIVAGECIRSCITKEKGLKGNAFVFVEPNIYTAQQRVIDTAKKFGLKAFQSGFVQVLCPIKAGATGVHVLNYVLQQELNPCVAPERDVVYGKLSIPKKGGGEDTVPAVFRVGDVVIHTKNNYNQPWFRKHPINGYIESSGAGVVNGDTGVIEDIKIFKDSNGTSHRILYVRYDDHYISYDNDFDELMLAYAMTIHKSQGSQWPVVICPITQRTTLLNRKLMYTMYTRAQDTHVLIGNLNYIDAAVKNNYEDMRCTLLLGKLTTK